MKNTDASARQVHEPAEPSLCNDFIHRSVMDVRTLDVVSLVLHAHLQRCSAAGANPTISCAREVIKGSGHPMHDHGAAARPLP